MKLHCTQKVLRTHEEMQGKIKEVRFYSSLLTLAVTATTPTQTLIAAAVPRSCRLSLRWLWAARNSRVCCSIWA